MIFDPPLIPARLIKRYKRFLADVVLENHQQLTVHCPNTGSMKNCWAPNWQVYLHDSNNPKRKYRYTWTIAENDLKELIGVNTHLANKLVIEGIEKQLVKEIGEFETLQTEVKYGTENSRIDILVITANQPIYIEVKSVTLKEADGCGYFPDAVTTRGQKHLRELITIAESGKARAILLFCVQHTGIKQVKIAEQIDPDYADLCRKAIKSGVEIVAYTTNITPKNIAISGSIPVYI